MRIVPPSVETDAFPLPDTAILFADLDQFLAVARNAAERADASGEIDAAVWDALRRAGLSTAPFPIDQGGAGLATPRQNGALFDVLRRLGGADLSLARLYEGHVNAIALVTRYGREAQLADLAAAVRDGALAAVWGADDAQKLEAVPEGDGWRLRGRKIFASGAGFVARPLVTAATPDGPMMLLLHLAPGERADASGWTAQGMRSTATGMVTFDGLVVGRDHAIGQPGDFMRQPHFSGGAWRFCAAQLGAAERLVDLFRAHLVARGRAEDPYQLDRVAACATAVGTAAFWIAAAARRVAEEGADADAVVGFVNLTRGVTERAALDVLEAVHRGVGLGSFLRPHPIERVARDLSTYLRQPVPDLAMADAARAVLASPRATADLWPEVA